MFIDYLIIVLYALGMVAVAVVTSKRSKSVNEFLLAGKKGLNGWMSAFAYGTTYFSAVIFIGYAGKFGYSFGLAAIWIGVGNAILGSLIAWKLLAKKTKNMTTRLQSKTMPEFFEKRFGSSSLKIVSAIIIFIFLIPYSASVYNGLSSLFKIVFDIDGWIIMVALAILTALYLFFGGYFATALSDFIQGIIMIFGVVLMVIFFLKAPEVDWDLSKLTSDKNLSWFTFNNDSKGLYGATVSLVSLILLTSMGVYGLPQTVHKYYAVRDKKAINQGMIVSTLFALIIGFGAYFVGALSPLFLSPEKVEQIGGFDFVIPTLLAKIIPAGLIGIISVLILSASMSTLSSVSLTSASVIAVDIYQGKINKNATDKQISVRMRILCLVFVAISLLLAILNEYLHITAIAYMMGLSWGVLSGCFIGPFVYSLYSKKITKLSCWFSIIGTLVITAILLIVFGYDCVGWDCTFSQAILNGISSSPLIGIICMAYSLIITPIVSKFSKKPNQEIIDNAFNKQIDNEII